MTKDIQHQKLIFHPTEIAHSYGKNVHILSDPFHLSLLNKLCHTQTVQPWVNYYVEKIYSMLFATMVNLLFPYKTIRTETRMKTYHSEGVFEGQVPTEDYPLVCVNLARAGTLPAHICYDAANHFLPPENVRQDHFYVNRRVNEKGEVVGVDMSGSKVGGPIDKAFVVIPDPMGATGGTLSHILNYYKEKVPGKAERFIALHLIITPEYIKRIKKEHPEIEIICLRLDRGLSAPHVLNSPPGTYWDEERGLNDKQYIVPGGGGLGEVLNNSYV